MLLNRKFGEVQLIPDVPSTAAWLGWLEGSEQGLVVRMVFDRVVSNRLFAFLERYLNDWWGVVYLGGFWPGSEELQFELIGDRELFRIAPRVVEFAAPWWIVHRSAMAALMNGLYSRTIFAFDEKLIEVEAE